MGSTSERATQGLHVVDKRSNNAKDDKGHHKEDVNGSVVQPLPSPAGHFELVLKVCEYTYFLGGFFFPLIFVVTTICPPRGT